MGCVMRQGFLREEGSVEAPRLAVERVRGKMNTEPKSQSLDLEKALPCGSVSTTA